MLSKPNFRAYGVGGVCGHIKALNFITFPHQSNSVLKAYMCETNMPYVCWGEHYVVFKNDMTVGLFFPFRLYHCNLDVSKAQVLEESLKCTSKLRTIR